MGASLTCGSDAIPVLLRPCSLIASPRRQDASSFLMLFISLWLHYSFCLAKRSRVLPLQTTSTTLRLTQPYQTTTLTLSPSRAARLNLCGHQVSDCPVCPRARGGVAGDGSPTQ